MKKVFHVVTSKKVLIAILSLAISLSLLISTSYAWLTLSGNPAVNSIEVAIAGGQTIMLASDIKSVVNGQEVHYPSAFSDTISFSNDSNYAYLKDIDVLTPVSTYDGKNWFFATYDEETHKLNPYNNFILDDTLQKANSDASGCYAYLDFWVVSPGTDYDLRISMDKVTGKGSYLIELPNIRKKNGSYQLTSEGVVASSARVGFLVNEDPVTDELSLYQYMQSSDYDDRYNSLLGVYNNVGQQNNYDTKYIVYEPNADYHPNNPFAEGSYLNTYPLTLNESNEIVKSTTSIERRFVQTTSHWDNIDEIFNTATINKSFLTADEAAQYFYDRYLQSNYDHYVECGKFVTYNSSIYEYCSFNPESVAGATEDQIIVTLKKNIPQRIRMFIYIEGQDRDCENVSYISCYGLGLSIEFAGSSK